MVEKNNKEIYFIIGIFIVLIIVVLGIIIKDSKLNSDDKKDNDSSKDNVVDKIEDNNESNENEEETDDNVGNNENIENKSEEDDSINNTTNNDENNKELNGDTNDSEEYYAFYLDHIPVVYDKEYINDYDFKFVFAWLSTKDAETDVFATGDKRVPYSKFCSYYQKIFDSEFDVNKLNKNSDLYRLTYFPVIQNDYIWGNHPTGYTMGWESFEYIKLIYDENTDLYTMVFDNIEFVRYDDAMQEEIYEKIGEAELKYSLDENGNKVYKSFIVRKKI